MQVIKHFKSLFTSIILILFFWNNAYAEIQKENLGYFKQNLAFAGVTYNQSEKQLDVTVDTTKTDNAIRLLEDVKAIKPNAITAEQVKKRPITYSSSLIGLFFTGALVRQVYRLDDHVDKLTVNVYLLNNDTNAKKERCYSFNFDRKLYNSIDWNSLLISDLIKKAYNFNFTDWCSTFLKKEDLK